MNIIGKPIMNITAPAATHLIISEVLCSASGFNMTSTGPAIATRTPMVNSAPPITPQVDGGLDGFAGAFADCVTGWPQLVQNGDDWAIQAPHLGHDTVMGAPQPAQYGCPQ